MQLSIQIIGWFATALLFIAFAPQSYKVIKAKSAEGVSKITFPIVFIGSSLWSIYGSFGGYVQPWLCNAIIVIMMLPTIYYILKDNLKIMIAVISVGLSIILVAFIFFIMVKIDPNNKISIPWLSWLFVSLAGTGTGLSYIPQLISIIRSKKIGNVSVLTLTIVSISNVGWIIYWTLKFLYPGTGFDTDYTCILSIGWSIMGFVWQLPVIYLYIVQRIQRKTIKK